MARHDSDPDPYTYTVVDKTYQGRVYEVRRDGVLLGRIVGGTRSTDTKVAGTRFRRIGKGAPAFYEVGDRYRVPYDRRRDAARALERRQP